MEEDFEAFYYDNSEPEDVWWNGDDTVYEGYETYDGTVSENVLPDMQDGGTNGTQDGETGGTQGEQLDNQQFDELLETLTGASSYGTMGDYYNQQLGCYVFPSYEVYGYFIDIDAYGGEWSEASDGHYVPVQYLEAYEGYITSDDAAEPVPTESELQNIETLESIRGILSVIKENNTTFFDSEADFHEELLGVQQETLEVLNEISMKEEGILYGTITECVFLGIIAGSYIGHVFWGRMRVG